MTNTLILATYSKARRYLNHALSTVEDIQTAVHDIPDTNVDNIPHIRAIVNSLDPIVHERIPLLLAVLRKQPIPCKCARTGHDYLPLYRRVGSVDPTVLPSQARQQRTYEHTGWLSSPQRTQATNILDTTNVHQWLAARPESMSRVESPPIYDSDHPEYRASSSEDETSDGESSDDSSDSEKENVPPE
ncbi:hypothetical protein BT96DRAFT_995109 [Gymnopus androsaceus JB14]|uniref:Uncharacterized protein n=1 Tax=Gymnopus androsaceus JB14 TaxID=1447944 RepID=A0A6A4HLD8_9AGAR|nr:hypothetical protein BT96DRAFT_995109 [Gymnopus androsaceus JB14]